ncbi:tyrosine-type recombinase/integrase [Burkholderia cepacia]|uniref:tyrosine-type recombinase/integrase n=1 Tax=Burkholderia cepacia TaxID=292 RepID=UPI0009C1031D|nr:site-specific integrase [Burkholderia cepacia]
MNEKIDTKTARARLKPRRDAYWTKLARGLYVGYRLPTNGHDGENGTWSGRRAADGGGYAFQSFGSGLEYDDACNAVRKWNEEQGTGVARNARDWTVADVCRAYIKKLRADNRDKTAGDTEGRFKRRVYDKPFGAVVFAKLTTRQIEGWREAQLERADANDPESVNRVKDSINREMKALKAALNYGKNKLNLVSSDNAWRAVEAYRGVASQRKGWLSLEHRTALLDVMDDDLREFALGLLLTGARPGELSAARVRDFDKGTGILHFPKEATKTKKERAVPLSDDARAHFERNTKGRKPSDLIFLTDTECQWKYNTWGKRMKEARDAVKMPDVVIYYFRHTHISESISQGIDVYTIAKLTGTSVEMIEKNYGHLTDDIVERLNRVSILKKQQDEYLI